MFQSLRFARNCQSCVSAMQTCGHMIRTPAWCGDEFNLKCQSSYDGVSALETLPLIQSKMICAKSLNTSISYKIQGCLQRRTQLACAYRRLMITNRWHWAKCDIHLPLRNAFLIIILHENCHSLAVPKIKTKREYAMLLRRGWCNIASQWWRRS